MPNDMPPPKVELHQLTKHYGSATALQPTDLQVRQGEFLTLLGPSGSGKTTLLMMIAGLTKPSGGRILLEGREITDWAAFQRGFGMVFQNYALFPHLTVAQNVAFPLEMRRRPRPQNDAAVARALGRVHLAHLAGRYPRELSGGQQQRVALARAIVFEPALVMMDEPLGALDKRLRDQLKLQIRQLHRELGTTILYVTHDQDEAMFLSDRICLMNEARVEQLDTPRQLYNFPRTRFAADFVGESNLLQAVSLATDGGATQLRLTDGSCIATSHGGRMRPGDNTDILIRPERIWIGAAGQDGGNQLDVTVSGVVDLGGTFQVQTLTAGGIAVRLTLLGGSAPPLAVGARVILRFSADDVVPLGQP